MDRRTLARATERFYEWELRGRGWQRFSHRVTLEPAFIPFDRYQGASANIIDDARKPSFLSSLFRRLSAPSKSHSGDDVEAVEEPEPDLWSAQDFAEFEILVPPDQKIEPRSIESMLAALSGVGTLCFELLCMSGRVSLRFAGGADEAPLLLAQLRAFYPAATIRKPTQDLTGAWATVDYDRCAALEFGLSREFMVPLRELRPNPDPLTPIVAALGSVDKRSFALFQVLFEPARAPWQANIERAVTAADGEPFFLDAPEITTLAQKKIAAPLYAVAIRALACSEEGAVDTVMRMAGALNQFSGPDCNGFVPLAIEDGEELVQDILTRSTHRSGMLLSRDELATIVRMPSEHLQSTVLLREETVDSPLPDAALSADGVMLGQAAHRGDPHMVRLPVEARFSHIHCIGASGTGKSTLLESLILQDIVAGRGVGVVDPHGDLVDAVCARIPDERIDDVVLFDPSDTEGVVGWNILGAHSDIEKELLASDLVSVFRRLSTSWGDQMSVLLANAVLAFLESPRGGTLIELRRFLLDDAYREGFLRTVHDDHVVSFWRDEYPLLIGKKPQAPILTRLDTFLRSKLIRERVTERQKPLNFRDIIDTGKIFLAKLSQGAIGEENAALLGSLIVSKLHQVSLSRQNVAREERRPFFLYIDEFQHVVVPSMAGLFSGLRKYNLSVLVAHQDLYALHSIAPEVERSVLTNAYTRVAFRVSDEDARKLERSMGEFTAADLTNLSRGQAICRMGRSEDSFRISTQPLAKVDPADAERRLNRIRRTSVARWGRPRVGPNASPDASPPDSEVAPVREPEQPKGEAPRSAPEPRPMRRETVAATPGRGGEVHKYLQGMISECAHKNGFKAEIEHTLQDGGRVDVALTRDDVRIACEVAGTTTVERETANVRKCLDAGFTHICSVSIDAAFLRRLDAAVSAGLPDTDRSRVHFFSPEELLAFIGAQMMMHSAPRVAGYKVEVRRATTSSDDADRRRAIAEIMMKSVRRMKEKK